MVEQTEAAVESWLQELEFLVHEKLTFFNTNASDNSIIRIYLKGKVIRFILEK